MPADEGGDFTRDDVLDIAASGIGLADLGSVHVELERRAAQGQHIMLETGRNVEREGVARGIQPLIHLRAGNDFRTGKVGRIKGIHNTRGKLGAILIHNGDGRVVQRFRHGGRGGVNRQRKDVDHHDQEHRIPHQAVEFLVAQIPDIVEKAFHKNRSLDGMFFNHPAF